MPNMVRMPCCLEETISDTESSAITKTAARVATIIMLSRGHLGTGSAGSTTVLLPAGGIWMPTTETLRPLPMEPISVAPGCGLVFLIGGFVWAACCGNRKRSWYLKKLKDVWLRTHPRRICDAPVTPFCTCFLTVLGD